MSAIDYVQQASHERLVADVTGNYVATLLFFLGRRSSGVVRPALLFLGLVSYSLYLFHPLVLDLVATVGRRIGGRRGFALIVGAVPLAAVALAALVQRLVEAPANRWGRAVRHRRLGTGTRPLTHG